MRIGIVTKWFNRGQAYVSRHLRTALDQLGHETFILARPTRDKGPTPAFIDRSDVWDAPGVTEASAWEVPGEEFERWAAERELEAIFFDNSYQFAEIASLRRRGIATIGRWVWEDFRPDHVPGAQEAFDVVYSLTRCEQARYRELGIESPYVQWGVHPELLEHARDHPDRAPTGGARDPAPPVSFYFPGALLGPRKPHREVVEAFGRTSDPDLRLIVKAQVERRGRYLREAAERDPRIELVIEDLPTAEHLRLFAGCDVCLSPSRWEGLGLFLYEATAFGLPTITNDDPPMNEVIEDGENGLLVPSHPDGHADSGIEARRPDTDRLAAAIERLADPGLRGRLAAGTRRARERLAWERTVSDFGELLARVGSPAADGR